MAQDISSATETHEDRARHTVLLKRRTVFDWYAQGGGVLGLIPVRVGAHIEKLIETPLSIAIQVKEAASTGGPFIAGISMRDPKDPTKPRYTCDEIGDKYVADCPALFPEMPWRMAKMLAVNGMSIVERLFDPSKVKSDIAYIKKIDNCCDQLNGAVPVEKMTLVDALRDRATKRWMTHSDLEAALKLCRKFSTADPGNTKKNIQEYSPTEKTKALVAEVGNLISLRSTSKSGRLTSIFRRATVASFDVAKKHWLNTGSYTYNPHIRQNLFEESMGQTKLSQAFGSVYFAAFDTRRMSYVPFYARKKDFFSTDPDSECVMSHPDMKMWDASMATTANLLAYPPHRTQNGFITSDKAPIHTPIFGISEIISNINRQDTDVVLIIASTGHYETDDGMDDDQLYKHYVENNVLGNDRELEEAKAYAITKDMMAIANLIGGDNIIQISPRMSWHNDIELQEFPSSDITDARPENMAKIEKRAQTLIVEEDQKIRRLCQMLADNLYLIGQMDKVKFDRVTERLGIKDELEAKTRPAAASAPIPRVA